MATFHRGDALALPFGDGHFDAAIMALVIFFVPDPTKGVAEMARVVRRGGTNPLMTLSDSPQTIYGVLWRPRLHEAANPLAQIRQ